MGDAAKCTQCGAALPEGILQGLCPRCVARQAEGILAARARASDPSTPNPQPSANIRHFGDYELLEEIARGGMGAVWKARQLSLNRTVAVKLLLAGKFSSPEFLQRFRAEAEAAANLQHPNIVAIHEVGEYEGHPYFSMDYVDGPDLGQLVRREQLPARRAAELARTIAVAVQYAHQRGVIHRDLKPSNVLLDPTGQPRVTDFGLAKRFTSNSSADIPPWTFDLTVTGQVLGTPSFMPPEQAGGRKGAVGVGSDVYSLGALLYFLLTGRPPFAADTLEETLHQVRELEPISPRLINPAVPRDLETISLKCLSKETPRRYATALELAEDLDRFLNGESICARPASKPEKLWRWCRRKPALAGLILAVHLVGALGLAGILWQWREARHAQRESTDKLWEAYVAQARANRSSDAAGRRQAGLELITKATAIRPSLELRNEAIATLAMLDVRPGRKWPVADAVASARHFDADLKRYAIADGTNGIKILRTTDDTEISALRHPSRPVKGLFGVHALSPDGRFVLVRFAEEKHCVVWEVATARILLDDPGFRHGMDFSRDGNRLAASHADGSIRIHDLVDGKEVTSLKAGGPRDFLRFNTEGNRLLGCNVGATQFDAWDVTTGQVQTFTAPDRLNFADWGTGNLLAAGAATGRIFVWDARSGQLRQIIPAHDSEIQQVAFNHRGDLLASVSWDGQTRFSNPLTGRVEIRLPRLSASLMFSRDDRHCGIVFLPVDNQNGHGLLELEESPVLGRIESSGNLRHAWSLGFSRDGRWLACAVGESVGIRVFDTAGRRLVAALPECEGRSVLFEKDGRGLLTTTSNGIVRLPMTTAGQGTNQAISFGTPEVVFPLTNVAIASLSRDGRWLACTAGPNEVWRLDLQNPKNATLLGRQRSALMVAVSPDGQWVASGNWHGYDGVWIWNTRTHEVAKRIPLGQVKPEWSPDGRWVAVTGITEDQRFKFLVVEADSWRVRHESESLASIGMCVFSPDSQLLAFVSDGGRAIRLHDVGSFRHLATLEGPNHGQAAWLTFSPDGNRLAALEYRQGIQIWDLPRLREELRARGLDWERPPHPPEQTPPLLEGPPLSVINEQTAATAK